jgi:hypothetical protein
MEVVKIEAEFEEKRAQGGLRTINQDYRKTRQAAQLGGMRRVPTYSAYVLELRRKAVRTHAERLGAQVMAAGDLHHGEPIEVPE